MLFKLLIILPQINLLYLYSLLFISILNHWLISCIGDSLNITKLVTIYFTLSLSLTTENLVNLWFLTLLQQTLHVP